MKEITQTRLEHARAIAAAGSLENALQQGAISRQIDTTLSEALVLGLLRQGVKIYFTVFGHGSTEVGEVLRVYQQCGLVRVLGVRSEIEASHAAAALRWVTGQKAAVVTSIGPGALQALAASLAPASDGLGVWYLFGDETSEDEGYNMQQIPRPEQNLFLRMASVMGSAYSLHTPGALPTALQRGLNTVDHPYRAGPFYLLMPMNTQPAELPGFNLDELPTGSPPKLGAAAGDYDAAVRMILQAQRVVVKIGGGGRRASQEILEFLELADAVAVWTPIASGAVPYQHPRNMTVGGSKGSLCGNYAMENADMLVAIGTRAVCQSDCSRTGYPSAQQVINLNASLDDATHYHKTLALVGDAAATLQELNAHLRQLPPKQRGTALSLWSAACQSQRQAWEQFKQERYDHSVLLDPFWKTEVITQPAVIKTATDWARQQNAITFFDAGDVQANGFQVVEDDRVGRTFTETGASYMGFAVSALLSTAVADPPFYGLAVTGDGSFTMNPQVLIDGAEHGARGCILLLDNNRMGAISSLQTAQYGADFATSHQHPVDYLAWARTVPGVLALDGGNSTEALLAALELAHLHRGLSLVQVRVYYGEDELGGMGVYGHWNVGNWAAGTQDLRHRIGL